MGWDIALRAAGASLLLVTAAVLMLSAARAPVSRWFLPFALGIAGFLGVNTAFDAAELPAPWWSIASFLSRMAAVFVWLFCLALFDGRLHAPKTALAVVLAWLLLVVLSKGYVVSAPTGIDLSKLQIALGTALLLHAGWRLLRDLRDDLIDRRRRARPVFALALLGMLALDFAADLSQGYGWRPASFLLFQNATIVLLTAGLALWLLRADDWLRAAPAMQPPPSSPTPAPDPDATLLARIETAMRTERAYLEPELTIAQLAVRVGVPEPVLRRAINHRLGHGHFRSFVNGYRIEEARRRLRDPASAGDKILAIALDSGFASLASFNRVFRQAVGCTPSDYRAGTEGADFGPE